MTVLLAYKPAGITTAAARPFFFIARCCVDACSEILLRLVTTPHVET